MNDTQRLRIAGFCGIIGGLIYLFFSILFEVLFPNLAPPGTPAYAIVLGIIAVVYALLLIGFLGIRWGGGLTGRFGTIVFSIAVLGYLLMVVGTVLQIAGIGPLTDPPENVSLIFLLGRLVVAVFTLLTGIAVLMGRRWKGWTRFAPLLLGLWPLLTELVPLILVGNPLPDAFLAVWGLFGALLGLAVLGQTRSVRAGAVVAVGHS
jgi:hypothetical protein